MATGRGRGTRRAALIALIVGLAALTRAAVASPFAETQRLNADLLGGESATKVLTRWCAEHHLATPPAIVARRLAAQKPATAQVRALLAAAPGEEIRYRRVALTCGRRVLSVADNWYRPAALTPQMNAALATTETPFGAVVSPLGFHRRNLSAEVLISAHARRAPQAILRHRALLETADGAPFSYVVETYLAAALGSAP